MKKILFLLLLTVSVYGQNPSRFAKIQITGNTTSATATKVNVQESNGEVNTQTINTGFNKNVGLGVDNVVGSSTLLNQYSTTPADWVAQSYSVGAIVFYAGKQWIAKSATISSEIPATSSKWADCTFEALANSGVTVDQTLIDGSTNAVSGNAVFDGLAGKFNTPTGLTTNYLPKWNGTGFGNTGIIENIGLSISSEFTPISTFPIVSTTLIRGEINAKDNNVVASDAGLLRLSAGGGTALDIKTFIDLTGFSTNALYDRVIRFGKGSVEYARFAQSGNTLFGKTTDAGDGLVQVNGNITASPAVAPNQVVVKSQLDAVGRPYKVYTALISQTGTNAPVATVIENTLGVTLNWSRSAAGLYAANFSSSIGTTNKIAFLSNNQTGQAGLNVRVTNLTSTFFDLNSNVSGTFTDDRITGMSLEIRVYN